MQCSFAQITITGANLPQAGYTYFTDTDTTPSISLGTPGATAQAWNFTSLTSDYPSVPTYGLTSWTPYASAFPTSNVYTYGPAAMYSGLAGGAPVGSQGMSKGYMFWQIDNTGFWTVGFRQDSGTHANVNFYYNPKELLIGAPCTYGNSFNNNSRWELPMNVNSMDVDTYYVSRTVKTITCDAWGSLTTPFGNFPDVIRQHEYVIKYDSVYAKFGTTVVSALELMRDTSNNYVYLSDLINYPASMVHADKNNVVKRVEWYSGVITNVQSVSKTENELNIFPNPVTDGKVMVNFVLNEEDVIEIAATDLRGRKFLLQSARKYSAGKHSIVLDVKDLSMGVYSFEAAGSRAVSVQKVLITE